MPLLGDSLSVISSEAYLEPIPTPLTRLVATFIRIQHFYHQTFTGCLDTIIKQCLDLIQYIGVSVLSELEFAFRHLERFM